VSFPWEFSHIEKRVNTIDPIKYGASRNYIDGDVTKLSPYISRGVISSKYVLDHVLQKGFKHYKISKFIQELAWREYYQNLWWEKKDLLFQDLKNEQTLVKHREFPKSVFLGDMGIHSLNKEILDFYKTGYLHNHVRMYLASIICNVAGAYWELPSQWMFYYLKDADPASNVCSWQWVAGSFSNKKYFANQENINRYLHGSETGTFLDTSYEFLMNNHLVPEILKSTISKNEMGLETNLQEWALSRGLISNIDQSFSPSLDFSARTLILYDFYNLDPIWHKEGDAERVLLLEPSLFDRFPVSNLTLDFIWDLGRNISNLKLFVGEFSELKSRFSGEAKFYFKEHPTNSHYIGVSGDREWMFPEVRGYFPSFFSYWKKVEKKYFENKSGEPRLFPDL